LKRLLREAGVPVEAAEDLLTDAIAAISVEEVAHLSEVDLKLLRRVDAACAEYAANRQPACKGLKRRAARRRPRAERKGRGGV